MNIVKHAHVQQNDKRAKTRIDFMLSASGLVVKMMMKTEMLSDSSPKNRHKCNR